MINFSDNADHVGVYRSVSGGNLPHVIDRISSHRRALVLVLPVGAAKHHSANPSTTLSLERMYGSPVLLSGMASLVLNKMELGSIQRYHRVTLCRLQKLPATTPDCVVYFLSGSLPVTAILHLRQLSLLGMLARLGPNSPLQQIGRQALLHLNKGSWFLQLRSISEQ